MARLTPTYGWVDLPDYRGWKPGDPAPMPPASGMDNGVEGERLRLDGRVLTTSGTPIEKTRIEFWQADANGKYHMSDYRLRGVSWTDADGHFFVNTIMPGYAGQLRHIKYLATAFMPGRRQHPSICAGIYFATEDELNRPISAAEQPYVRPGAQVYRDDPAFLSLDNLRIQNGVRHVLYDIVFDFE